MAFFVVCVASILLAVVLLLAGYEVAPLGGSCPPGPHWQPSCEEQGR